MQFPIEIIALLAGLISVIILDSIGVKLLKKYAIGNDLKLLLSQKVDRIASIIVWILIVVGCTIFVVLPSSGYELGAVGLMGAFFGLVIYGVYECTNKALLFAWSWKLVIRDILRGMFLCASVSMIISAIMF